MPSKRRKPVKVCTKTLSNGQKVRITIYKAEGRRKGGKRGAKS